MAGVCRALAEAAGQEILSGVGAPSREPFDVTCDDIESAGLKRCWNLERKSFSLNESSSGTSFGTPRNKKIHYRLKEQYRQVYTFRRSGP